MAICACSGNRPAPVNASTASPLPTVGAEAEAVATVAGTEGPAVDADGFVYFTELVSQRIMVLSPNGIVSLIRNDSNGANGMVIDSQGRLVICEASDRRRRQARITRLDPKSGQFEVLAADYQGQPFDSPNDVTLDSRGRIYFTDVGPLGLRNGAVYRLDPDQAGRSYKITRILAAPDIERPNGLVISPDDKTLYLVESNRVPAFDRKSRPARMIRAYDLSPAGTASNMRVFHDFYPGRSADGLCIDTAGNVYAAAGLIQLRATDETLDTKAGVYVFSPAGRLLRFLPIPEDLVTNCAFGGPQDRMLYVTAGKSVFQLPVETPGMRQR
ncbi:MAG: SMP-30/gluconolactonase/LRE family protein [Bryobacterales bacterium]|nr:SMP-30/gluconolactonase/LRE family protein [Bryobacterales bacterium]